MKSIVCESRADVIRERVLYVILVIALITVLRISICFM